MRRRSFRRKKRLARLEELENEPGEEPSPYTSQNLRLGIVQPGHYVEWGSLSWSSLSSAVGAAPLWELRDSSPSPSDTALGEDAGDEDDHSEDSNTGAIKDMMAQMRRELEEEKKATVSMLNKRKKDREEWENTNFTLIVFEGKTGDAELIRLLFAASGTPLHEQRVNAEEWAEMKENMQYHTLPQLTKCGVYWGVTEAIVRMLAKKFLLMGRTNDEHLVVDATYERLRRVQQQHSKAINWVINEEKSKEKLEWAQGQLRHVVLPPCLNEWEQQIRLSEGPFIVSSGMTMADIAIMDFIDQCSSSMQLHTLLDDYFAVSDLITFVKADHRIGVYLDSRNKEE